MFVANSANSMNVLSIFVEDFYLGHFKPGDNVDMFLLYDLIVSFWMEKQSMISYLKPLLVIV